MFDVRNFFARIARPHLRTATVMVTVVATSAAYVGLSLPPKPARAADTETTALVNILDDLTTFVPQLAGVGQFAQAIPTLDVVPGGANGMGLSTLLSEAKTSILTGLGGAADIDDFVAAVDGENGSISSGRNVSFTATKSTNGTVDSVTVGVQATRTITSGKLDISDDSPAFTLSSGGGVRVELTLAASFVLNYDSSNQATWITRTGSTPSLTIGFSATTPTPANVTAGLGILGISLGTDTVFSLSGTVGTNWSDPNNDGRLAFEEPGGGPDDGELSAAGAGAGLVTAALTAGTMNATLDIEASTSTAISLPAATAVVTVTDGDSGPGIDPQVSMASGALDAVNPFLTLSPRDLAQGLAQAASSVLALQDATGVKLPFMRGELNDAIAAVEAIQKFLDNHVEEPAPGTLVPGQPDFPSLQAMLEMLAAETALPPDTDLSVSGAEYVAAKEKVTFTLGVDRTTSASAQPLNPAGEPTSGTASYTNTTLTDGSANFTANGLPALIGRQVIAGTSSGIVLSATATTLTLDPVPLGNPSPDVRWQGGKPANGTPYTILAADPKIGLVELANTLKSDSAIANANAKVAQATVKPSFSLDIPIVLDLQAPDTSDCDPGPGTAACPFEDNDATSGISRIITSLPLPADRIMLRTPLSGSASLLTADAPIETGVDVDATVGFVGVRVTGTLKECTTNASANCTGATADGDHLLTLALKPVGGADADGDIPITEFFDVLAAKVASGDVSDILGFDVDGQAYASLTLSIPGAPDFFGSAAPSITGTVTMSDFTDPSTLDVDFDASQIARLAALDVDTSNPLALFGALLQSLQSLQGAIESVPGGSAGLHDEIPLLGRSFSEIIGSGVSGSGTGVSFAAGAGSTTVLTDNGKTFGDAFVGRRLTVGSVSVLIVGASGHTLSLKPALAEVPAAGAQYAVESELQGVINLLQANPSETLQGMLDLLETQLGGGSAVDFAVEAGSPPVLRLNIDWKRAYKTQAPVTLNFDVGSLGDQSLVGARGSGALNVDASGQVKLTMRLPLSAAAVANPAANLTIDPTASFVKAGVTINGDGVRLQANLGPFKAALGDPNTSNPAGTQLQAGLGVTLENASTTPETLGDFFGDLGVEVDGAGVSCPGAPVADGTDLALCAVFPAYLNGNPVNADPALNKFVVRLPVGTTLADTFDLDLDGGSPVGGQPRFVTPTGLEAALQAAALNLLTFGDGFFGYLEFLENALGVASFDGKLPVIGKDLQAGSDFIGGFRSDLETAFAEAGVPTNPTAGDIRNFLNTKLKPELPGGGAGLTIDLTCTTTLAPASTPGITAVNTDAAATPATYRYKVVAYTNADKDQTLRSPASAPVSNVAEANLDGNHHNDVTWAAVQYATGYIVLRSIDGGTYESLGDVGNVLSFVDDGTPDGSAADPEPASPPLVEPCPDAASPTEVSGFTIEVTIGQGNPTPGNGCTNAQCLQATLPVDLGIPGLSLRATDATGGVTGKVGWELQLKLGFSRDDGFFVASDDTPDPEFLVAASLDVPDTQAQLAFITVDETSNDAATPEFKGQFSIDLLDPSGGDGKITLDDLSSASIGDMVDVTLQAGVDIDWHLRATATSALPGISTDFLLGWDWTSDDPSNIDTLSIAFNNVKLDAGDFIGAALKPIIKQITDVYKPVQPIIDTIFAPIPVISDLSKAVGGDDVTIASLAAAFSTIAGGPDITPFLDVLQNIRDLLKALTADCGAEPEPCLTVGDFELVSSKAITTDANPGTAASLIAPGATVNNDLLADVDAATPGDLQGTGEDTEHPGFTFPFLETPSSIFGLIVGQDVALVEFDSGPLTLGFEFQKSFGPVYAPPPVNVVIGGGASVTLRIAAGFDTYGIRTAIENGKADAKILDSLYFKTTDSSGTPIPVVQFEGFLQAGASVSAVIIEVGIVGGIKLTVGFFWNDPNNDGKFRFGEFLATALSNPICLFNVGGELSLFIKVFITLGIDPFSVSFDFTLVSIKLLDFSLKPNCTPPPPKLGGTKAGVLYLFAGKFSSSTERGHSAWNSNNTAEETWVVRQVPPKPDPDGDGPKSAENAKVVVQALGITEDFDDDGGKITTVVLDGRGYAGPLQLMLNGGSKGQAFTKKAVVVTGSGEDVIRTGEGASYVDGGGGLDQITTFDRTDLSKPLASPKAIVAGGGGPDAITVGNAAGDTVYGDKSLTFNDQDPITVKTADGSDVSLTAALDPDDVGLPSNPDDDGSDPGGDQIAAGLGGATLYGNAGDDKIGTASDNPQADLAANAATKSLYQAHSNTIVGGKGSDRIKSGSADDTIYTGSQQVIDGDGFGAGDDATIQPSGRTKDQNAVDTGTGDDTVYGSNASDFVTTHSTVDQVATAYGGDAEDVLIGGAGEDALYGGPGDDYLVAEPAEVSDDKPVNDVLGSARRVTLVPTAGPSSEKTLVGGGGKDRIYGADGTASIFGDHEVDACALQSDPVSKQPPEHPTTTGPVSGQDNDDLILGGDGVDTVQAGGGNDHVFTYGDEDIACGNAGTDKIRGGDDHDLIYGGSDGDELYGEGGADQVYGNTGGDAAYGGDGTDRIEGNNGFDRLFGGAQDDLVIGGTSKAAEPDTGDLLYGDTGLDTLIGDNADSNVLPSYPTDLGTAAAADGGEDTVFGGADNDKAYGGLEDDYVYGGGQHDYLEGNNATDHVFGESGSDDIIGGSSQEASTGVGRPDAGDILSGGGDDDVITGDNAQLAKAAVGFGSAITGGRPSVTERVINLLDLGEGTATGRFGADVITGDGDPDVILGQRGNDRILAGTASDYAEGGPDIDWIEGGTGSDDLVGGSSSIDGADTGLSAKGQPDDVDVIWGQLGDDVETGDNALVTRRTPHDPLTNRVGPTGDKIEPRSLRLLDLSNGGLLGYPTSNRYGADFMSGQAGVDVMFGQDGADDIFGGSDDDYVEGQGHSETIYGDRSAADVGIPVPAATWPGSASAAYDEDTGPAGQDDLLGGSSRQGFRDVEDEIHGDGMSDFILGDNGTVKRDIQSGGALPFNDRIYAIRYANPAPSGAAKVRLAGVGTSTRFCANVNGGGCEPVGAFGGDTLFGDGGDDFAYGQDGNDEIRGGAQDDDIYGELGQDTLYGEAGDDAILGDRGGVRDFRESGATSVNVSLNQPPAITYTSRRAGSVSRVTDLLHEVNGDAFVGSGATGKMVLDGVAFGAVDRIRGGSGHDNLHGGFGDDLVNGDSGGDTAFGDDGADLLWGGKGCDPVLDVAAADCLSGGVVNAAARGTDDRMLDYLFGGKGATSGPSVAGGGPGADIIDWRPRGSYTPGTGCTNNPWPATVGNQTIDPCAWFEMTDMHNADPADNQHHRGVDWQYGGWDRDVLQGDLADNGPNPGDRLLDWTGAYNLYTHCNAAYGGFNDVRQFSPAMQDFLQKWAYGVGAGQVSADVLTPGTSAYVELALTYTADNKDHGTGKAFPTTPGHFDDPNSCDAE